MRYRRIPRGAIDTDIDLLLPEKLTLDYLDYVAQRKKCHDSGTFFLLPLQYFQIRRYASQSDLELDEILRAERWYERFDQIIDLKKDPPLVYNGPEIDFDSDGIILDKPIEAPYIKSYRDDSGFVIDDLNQQTGLPEKFVGEPHSAYEGFVITVWWTLDKKILEEVWDDVLSTPMFRARDGMEALFMEPYLNVDTRMPRYGVRECLLATPENLERLGDDVVG